MSHEDAFTGRYMDGWVSRRFVATLRGIRQPSSLVLYGRRYPWPERLTVSLFVNGELVGQAEVEEGDFTIQATIGPLARGKLEIVSSATFVPKEIGLNEDVRSLAFLLDDIVIPDMPDWVNPYQHLFDFEPGRTIYYMDEDLWDRIAFALDPAYRIPDRELLSPLQDPPMPDKAQASAAGTVGGMLYDKFSGQPIGEGTVRLIGCGGTPVREAKPNRQGEYAFGGLPPGECTVTAQAEGYGVQTIVVAAREGRRTIHIPLLPLS